MRWFVATSLVFFTLMFSLGFLREDLSSQKALSKLYARALTKAKTLERVRLELEGILGELGAVYRGGGGFEDVLGLVQEIEKNYSGVTVKFLDNPVYGKGGKRFRVVMTFKGDVRKAFEASRLLLDRYPVFVVESVELSGGVPPEVTLKGFFSL